MTPEVRASIDAYRASTTPLPKIIVIYGPTACGKTSLAIEVAQYIGSDIISADSRQIYRGLDIGTGKVTPGEMQGVKHHMLDIIDPSEVYSMVDYRKAVDQLWIVNCELWIIDQKNQVIQQQTSQKQEVRGSEDFLEWAYSSISECKKSETDDEIRSFSGVCPIICGGTGLYIDSILYDMDYPDTPPDWAYRDELERIRQDDWDIALWNMLDRVDPEYARELIPENYRYVMRGLEVIRATGRSKREAQGTKRARFSPLFLTPYRDREDTRKELYAHIDTRIGEMFSHWLVEEVRYNIWKYSAHCPGLETIGYKEVVAYLEWHTTLDATIALIVQHSRNYAKRQITWNKKYGKCS